MRQLLIMLMLAMILIVSSPASFANDKMIIHTDGSPVQVCLRITFNDIIFWSLATLYQSDNQQFVGELRNVLNVIVGEEPLLSISMLYNKCQQYQYRDGNYRVFLNDNNSHDISYIGIKRNTPWIDVIVE